MLNHPGSRSSDIMAEQQKSPTKACGPLGGTPDALAAEIAQAPALCFGEWSAELVSKYVECPEGLMPPSPKAELRSTSYLVARPRTLSDA